MLKREIEKGVRKMQEQEKQAAELPSAEAMKREAIRALKKANEDYGNAPLGQQIKVALCRFILDEAGVSEKELRQAAMNAFMATPSWFGASANAMTESEVVPARKRGDKIVGGFNA